MSTQLQPDQPGQQEEQREARVSNRAPRPPIRAEAPRGTPVEDDGYDADRVALVLKRWTDLDEVYFGINRQVELHIRMLAGRQWDVWNDVLGRYVDPLKWMTDEERRWRQRPVMDYLRHWFLVTLSKVTENEPVVGFLPANLDDRSAALAEVMDPIYKDLWDKTNMPERYMAAAGWAIAGGESYFISRPDYSEGEDRELIGPAVLSLDRGEGQDPIERTVDSVPYDANGDPLAHLVPDPENEGEYGYDVTGDPHTQKKGCIKVDTANTLEVRAQWGTNIPWEDKRWCIHRWFLPPEEVEGRWGVEVDADTYPDGNESSPGYLERLLFGAGNFGAARQDVGAAGGSVVGNKGREGYVCGYTMWEKPDDEFPEGRLTIIADGKVLADTARPFNCECAGPIRPIKFVPIPGRPIASTPLEILVSLQKRLNRIEAQVAEHTNLCTNPVLLLSAELGIEDDDFVARPGLVLTHDAPPSAAVDNLAKWLVPPQISEDVWRHKTDVVNHMFTVGSISGNSSDAPSSDPSGELIQQLRYNADRPLAPFTRSLELAAAGVAEDWMVILPTIWTEEEVIHYAGEDNAVRTITVLPDMWDGKVTARPVMESAAPESREKRLQRVGALYQLGLFDPPGVPPMMSAEGKQRMLELSRFPDLTRASKPGGVHRRMGERILAELVRGKTAQELPLLEVYDLAVHAAVLEEFMAGPDYLDMKPDVQQQMELRRQMNMQAAMAKQVKDMETEGQIADVAGAIQAQNAAKNGLPPGAPGGAPPAGGDSPAASAPPPAQTGSQAA